MFTPNAPITAGTIEAIAAESTEELIPQIEAALQSPIPAFLVKTKEGVSAVRQSMKVSAALNAVLSRYGFTNMREAFSAYMGTGRQFHVDGLGVPTYLQANTTGDEQSIAASEFTFAVFWPTLEQHQALGSYLKTAAIPEAFGPNWGTTLNDIHAILQFKGLLPLAAAETVALYAEPGDTLGFLNGYNAAEPYCQKPLIAHQVRSVDLTTHEPIEQDRYVAMTRLQPFA